LRKNRQAPKAGGRNCVAQPINCEAGKAQRWRADLSQVTAPK
jgi:hypothetical protein